MFTCGRFHDNLTRFSLITRALLLALIMIPIEDDDDDETIVNHQALSQTLQSLIIARLYDILKCFYVRYWPPFGIDTSSKSIISRLKISRVS